MPRVLVPLLSVTSVALVTLIGPGAVQAAQISCETPAPQTVASEGEVTIAIECSNAAGEPVDGTTVTVTHESFPYYGTVRDVIADAAGLRATYGAKPLWYSTSSQDSLTFKVTDADGIETRVQAQVTVTSPVSCQPPATINVRPGTVQHPALPCYGMMPTYAIPEPATVGTASIVTEMGMSRLRYEAPADAMAGAVDEFTVRTSISDGSYRDVRFEVVIDPQANTLPTCYDWVQNMRAGSVRTVTISCPPDAEGDTVTLSGDAGATPLGGSVTQLQPSTDPPGWSMTYTAPAMLETSGQDEITYRIADNFGGLDTRRRAFTVYADDYNTPPMCGMNGTTSIQAYAGGMPAYVMGCYDSEGDALTYSVTTEPSVGDVTLTDGQIRYAAPAGASGSTTFTISADDKRGGTATLAVDVTLLADSLSCVQPPPVRLRPDGVAAVWVSCHHASYSYDPLTTSISGLNTSIVQAWTTHGTLHVAGVAQGSTSIELHVSSASVPEGTTLSVPVEVDPTLNAPPSCTVDGGDAPIAVRAGSSRSVRYSCTDPDGDGVTVTLAEPQPVLGTVAPVQQVVPFSSGATFTYTADAGQTGPDTVRLNAGDARGGSIEFLIDVNVIAADTDTAPTCAQDAASVMYAGASPMPVHVGCSDAEGDALSYALIGAASLGVATVTDALVVYAAPNGVSGSDSFTLRVTDSRGRSTDVALAVDVIADQITCRPGSASVPVGGKSRTYLPCWHLSGHWEPVRTQVVQAPDVSVAEIGVGAYGNIDVYGYAVGNTDVTLRATSDRDTAGAEVTIALSVGDLGTANSAPYCSLYHQGTLGVRVGASRSMRVYCYDEDGQELTAALDPARAPVRGTATVSREGARVDVAYSAQTVGADAFDVLVSDPAGGQSRVRIGLHVVAADSNTPPLCIGQSWPQQVYSGRGAQQLWAYGECNDLENDAVSFEVVGASHGITDVTVVEGSFTFTPAFGVIAEEATITYRAVDSRGAAGHERVLRFKIVDGSDRCDDRYEYVLRPGGHLTTHLPCVVTDSGSLSEFEVLTAPDASVATHEFLTDGLYLEAAATGQTTLRLRASSPFGAHTEDVEVVITVAESANDAPWCSLGSVRLRRGETRVLPVHCHDANFDPVRLSVAGDNASRARVLEIEQPVMASPNYADSTGSVRLSVPADAALGADQLRLTVTDGRVTELLEMNGVEILPTTINSAPNCYGEGTEEVASGSGATVLWSLYCSDEDGDVPVFTITAQPAHGTLSVDPAGRGMAYTPDAGYVGPDTFSAYATDSFGGRSATVTMNVSVVPAPVTIVSGPIGVVSSSGGTFTFSSSIDGATMECRVDDAPFRRCTSPYEVAGLTDGRHALEVRALTAEGAIQWHYATRVWTVDTIAPTMSIDDAPSGVVASTTASFRFGSEAGATFECSLDEVPYAVCTSPHQVGELADGAHSMRVRAIDAVGNVGIAQVATWTVDATGPDTAITSPPPAASSSSSALISFAATDSDAVFECRLDGAAYESCTSPHALSDLADGPHTFEVRAIDTVGNRDASAASATWTVDTVAPQTTIDDPPSGTTSASVAVTFSSNEAGATFECSLDDGAFVVCSSPKQLDGLADGPHTISVRATDAVGNTGGSAVAMWTVDTVAPETTIDSGPAAAVADTSARIDFSSNDAGAMFECSLDGAPFAVCTDPEPLTGLAQGRHTFSVRSVDAVGNIDPSAAEWSWTVDTIAPQTTITRHPAGTSSSPTATIAFTADETATFTCRLNDEEFRVCTSPAELTDVPEGRNSFTVMATDTLGHADATPAIVEWHRAADATVAESTEAQLEAGGTLATNTSAPLAATIQTPVEGTVTAQVLTQTQTEAPTGYALLGNEVVISAPEATSTADPLRLTFVLDGASIPAGTDTSLVYVLRNGTPVTAACTGDTAVPTPCERSRTTLAGGDLQIQVLTMRASQWVFGRGTPAPAPILDADGDGLLDANDCAPADATRPNRTGTDANCDGAVDATTPPPTQNNDPVTTTPPAATRFASASTRLLRYRCPRGQVRNGVRAGSKTWCFRLVVAARLVRVDTGAALSGHTVRVTRKVGARTLPVGTGRTNARGDFALSRPVVVPRPSRRTLAIATRWLAREYARAVVAHAVAGTQFSAAPVRAVRITR